MIEIKSLSSDLELVQNNPSKVLELTVGSVKVTTPGTQVPKAEATAAPTLTLAGLSPSTSYTAICIDLDPPYASFSFLGPILHWIQTDLQFETSTSTLASTATPLASWLPCTPPPLSSPHRYLVLLYEQPAGFEAAKVAPMGGKALGMNDRLRFDYAKWIEEAGLGKPVAGSWFNSN